MQTRLSSSRWREMEYATEIERKRERKGEIPPHPSLLTEAPPPSALGGPGSHAVLSARLYGPLFSLQPPAQGLENAPEGISSRHLSFMMRLTSLYLPVKYIDIYLYPRTGPFSSRGYRVNKNRKTATSANHKTVNAAERRID